MTTKQKLIPVMSTRYIDNETFEVLDSISVGRTYNPIQPALGRKISVKEELENNIPLMLLGNLNFEKTIINIKELLKQDDITSKMINIFDGSYLNFQLIIETERMYLRAETKSSWSDRETDISKFEEETGIDITSLVKKFNETNCIQSLTTICKYIQYLPTRIYLYSNIKVDIDDFDYDLHLYDTVEVNPGALDLMHHNQIKLGDFKNNCKKRNLSFKKLLNILNLYSKQMVFSTNEFTEQHHLLNSLYCSVVNTESTDYDKAVHINLVDKKEDKPKYYFELYEEKLEFKVRDEKANQDLIKYLCNKTWLSFREAEETFYKLSAINKAYCIWHYTGELYIDIDYVPYHKPKQK